MKTFKWISLIMLMLGLCSSQVQAQCQCGGAANIAPYYVDNPTQQVFVVQEGEPIFYRVTIGVLVGGCDVENAEAWITLPDGVETYLGPVPEGYILTPDNYYTYESDIYYPTPDDVDGNNQLNASCRMQGDCIATGIGTGSGTNIITLATPCIDIDKTVDCDGDGEFSDEETTVGPDTPTWRIVVTNCSEDATLFNIQVTDTNGEAYTIDELAPGASDTHEYEGSEINETTTNTATAIGENATGVIVGPVSDSATNLIVLACIDIDKTVDCDDDGQFSDEETTEGPDTPTWRIVVTNCSDDATLFNIQVTDTNGEVYTILELAPGASDTHEYVGSEINETTTNTATAVGEDPLGGTVGPVEDSATNVIQGGIFCTFTQGYYGNAGGKKCGGIETPELIDALLASGGPVVVGLPGHSIRLNRSDCIIDLLPAGGTPAVLPAGNFGCPVVEGFAPIPSNLLKESKGKGKPKPSPFNNVLIGQIVALTLNLRLFDIDCAGGEETGDLASWVLPSQFCTIGHDGCIKKHTAPSGFVGMQVSEILAMANEAIAGEDVGASLSAINGVVSFFNETFDECAKVVSCPIDPTEICDNGCDDDFDGLTDLDDPDCTD